MLSIQMKGRAVVLRNWRRAAVLMAVIAIASTSAAGGGRRLGRSRAADPKLLAYVPPAEVSLTAIDQQELVGASPVVRKLLEQASELVDRGVQYRFGRAPRLSRERLSSFEPQLSCSEFVWYVMARIGLDTGNHHLETRALAYAPQVYPQALERVTDGSIRPGDLLVYEYPLADLERDQRETGRYRSGHSVIVVSAEKRIVVGSHYRESTPRDAPTGVGYRQLLGGWEHWTANRTLTAVYRVKNAWSPRDTTQTVALQTTH